MTLTPNDILDAAFSVGQRAGTARAWLARQQNSSRGNSTMTAAQRELFDTVAQAATTPTPRPTPYSHPGTTAHLQARARTFDPATGQQKPRDPLSAAEVAWLQRIPTDPSEVSFDDATTLLGMQETIDPNSTDAPLVRMVAAPVREYHDRAQAQHELEQASTATLPDVPAATLQALADVVAAENPTLTPREALGRASDLIAERRQELANQHDQKIAAAQAKLTKIDTAADARTAVHR